MSEVAVLSLTGFLLARLDEDEADAKAASGANAGYPWMTSTDDDGNPAITTWGYPADPVIVRMDSYDDQDHVARWSPARVLAEVAAKRAIVEDFEILHRDYGVTHDPSTEARRFQAQVAIARLAAVYADHPDYRDEWKP